MAVPLDQMTFGVRYVCEYDRAVDLEVLPHASHWRRNVRVFRDGERVSPAGDGAGGEAAAAAAAEPVKLRTGDAREYTFSVADALGRSELAPGRYRMFVDLDTLAHYTYPLEFDVWEEKDGAGKTRLMGKAHAQHVPVIQLPATRPAPPTSAPAPRHSVK